ncbi:MAG: amidohydrolase family protein [Bacteroidia bacterium]|nr:amidohydrolase family protein [Bacteroidia bacterium]
MKHALLIIASCMGWICSQGQPLAYELVIDNISIVDAVRQEIRHHQRIYIRDAAIARIESAQLNLQTVPDTIIDGTGKYIIPGFWDMHVHVCWKDHLDESVFPVLLSYGITGVRDMGGSADILNRFKQQLRDHPASGPVLLGPGPILDGDPPVQPDFSAALSMRTVRRVLDSLHDLGVDFFKVYSLLPQDVLEEIAAYSKERHIPFAGHISEYVSPEEAVAAGQASIEHLNGIEYLQKDSLKLQSFLRAAAAGGSWVCPTLIVYKRKQELAAGKYAYHPLYEGLDPALKLEWEQTRISRQQRPLSVSDIAQAETRYESRKKLVKDLFDAGIPLLTGSDFAGMPFVYPGYSLHEEMAALQSAGIPPFEILKMAVYNPAVFLGAEDRYGTIEAGKTADLVILDQNPAEDITHASDISLVIKSGKLVRK